MLDYKNVYLVSEKLDTVSTTQVDTAAVQLRTGFPSGYQEYVSLLGIGMFCEYVYVFPPQKVVDEVATYQQVFQEYSSVWSDDNSPIGKEELGDLIVFAQTVDIDKIAFHPRRPDQILMVPYTDDSIYEIGSNFYDALGWLYNFGVSDASDFMWFNSSVDQKYVRFFGTYQADLVSELAGVIRSLDPRTNVQSFADETWCFCRPINGYFLINKTGAKMSISCVFDKETRPLVDKIVTFLKERELPMVAEGDCKK